jgi:hypothetical protein
MKLQQEITALLVRLNDQKWRLVSIREALRCVDEGDDSAVLWVGHLRTQVVEAQVELERAFRSLTDRLGRVAVTRPVEADQ